MNELLMIKFCVIIFMCRGGRGWWWWWTRTVLSSEGTRGEYLYKKPIRVTTRHMLKHQGWAWSTTWENGIINLPSIKTRKMLVLFFVQLHYKLHLMKAPQLNIQSIVAKTFNLWCIPVVPVSHASICSNTVSYLILFPSGGRAILLLSVQNSILRCGCQ